MKFIGDKQIKNYQCDEITCEVGYEDGKTETLSKLMFDEIVADEKCDATTLRDKRVRPVVAQVLGVMRLWGIKTGEVGYFSTLLNQSLQNNEDQAIRHLWRGVIPTLETLDDVDLVAVDLVLKSIPPPEILSPKEFLPDNENGEDTPK